MHSPKVLQICSYYSNPLYRLLFSALNELGIEQKVYHFAVEGTVAPQNCDDLLFSACYNQTDRLFFKHKERKVLRVLSEKIDPTAFDAAHAHSLFSNGYAALELKRRYGIPYIVAVRNSDVNSFFRIRPWLRKTGVEIMREASRIVFISPAYRKTVLQQFVPQELRAELLAKTVIIPNGINKLFLDNRPNRPRDFDGVVRVIQVGEINQNKNQLFTSKACSKLIEGGLDIKLTIVGNISDCRIAKQLARYDFVDIAGPCSQKELITAYRAADIFVMPSKRETFGLAYVEAMSQGLPVIYTKEQGFDGYFAEGEVGYSIFTSDPQELAKRILDAYENRGTLFRTCIAKSALFTWENVAQEYFKIYSDTIIYNMDNNTGDQHIARRLVDF